MQNKLQAGTEIGHLLDPAHLNRSLCAAVSRATFSEGMFPGNSRNDKNKLQVHFADDISHQAQAETDVIFK